MSSVFRFGDVSARTYFAVTALLLGVLFALLGPEGTTERGFAPALAQWTIQVSLPMLFAVVMHVALHRVTRFDRWNPWAKLLISGSVAAFMFSPVAYGLDLVLVDGEPAASHLAAWTRELVGVYPPVVFTWLIINLPFNLGYRIQRETSPEQTVGGDLEAPTPMEATVPFFMTLVKPDQRGDLISLKSELHYLSVRTTAGQSLILYNLRDAMRELDAESGCQTHRSYWVNVKQVATLQRKDRAAVLRMKDGSVIPVSRNRMKAVQAAVNARA